MRVSQLSDFFDKLYPYALAEEWDNVGLIVGDPRAGVTGVMMAVDAPLEVLKEAQDAGCNVVVTHHPAIFRAIKRVQTRDSQGEVIAFALKHDISLIALHTNLDSAHGGLNDTLCELLGLMRVRPLVDSGRERMYKLAVTVPLEHAEKVRAAMCDAGAGVIGNYEQCSFSIEGEGSFRGDEERSKPAVGSAGMLERVKERRVEVILRRELSGRVVEAMKQAHPYDEVAFDLYVLHNKEVGTGLARIGSLEKPETLKDFVVRVRKLGIYVTRVLGDVGREVKKVALCSGAGGDFVGEACACGADVYLTAEIKHHHGYMARHAGMAIVETEHYSLERGHWPRLKERLEREFSDIKVKISERESILWQRPERG